MSSTPVDPEEYIEENRQEIIAVIRGSDDAFARAAAWALLDRHTPDNDLATLRRELEQVAARERE